MRASDTRRDRRAPRSRSYRRSLCTWQRSPSWRSARRPAWRRTRWPGPPRPAWAAPPAAWCPIPIRARVAAPASARTRSTSATRSCASYELHGVRRLARRGGHYTAPRQLDQELDHRDQPIGRRRCPPERQIRERHRVIERGTAPRVHTVAQALVLPVRDPAIDRRHRAGAQAVVEQLVKRDRAAAGLEPLVELGIAGLEDRRRRRPRWVEA